MAPPGERGDLILDPSQYVFIRDDKGGVRAYVGPQTKTIGANELPVNFKEGKFVAAPNQDAAIQNFDYVDQNSYLILNNPSADSKKAHPEPGSASASPDLQYGRKEVVTGPARFALWPGQTTRTIRGHVLRSNEYLVALVTNGDEATANWDRAILKRQATTATQTQQSTGDDGEQHQLETPPAPPTVQPPTTDLQSTESIQFSTGQRLVIKGTDYSFFIPPTGVEVLKDEETKAQDGGGYVRKAVTLESLQYCVLISENGEKRYVRGPAVVFPEPDESFIKADGDGDNPRIFKAIELNPQMGIHIKVIADYEDSDGTKHRAGEELFITGETQQLYYPRPEHAIIPYRDKEQIHYSVIVPEGEGRYVLDKRDGKISTLRGPKMLLVNPITQVMMRRVLSDKEARLWFPGNAEVEQVNRELREAQGQSEFLSERQVSPSNRVMRANYASMDVSGAASDEFGGDTLRRKKNFTLPKTITLKTKYDGAVNINVWPGYAVQTVSRTGVREVVVGPASVLLDFDQALAIFELSAGTPKGASKEKARGVYLRVVGNKVSDEVDFETSDLVELKVTLSYRVNFINEPEKWFALDDYVGFMVDHLRSIIRGTMKQYTIQDFMAHQVEYLRAAVLGSADNGARVGKMFDENNMHVYDVEVLDVKINDASIAQLLVGAQRQQVQQMLELQAEKRRLELTTERESIQRNIVTETTKTELARLDAINEKQSKELKARSDVLDTSLTLEQQQSKVSEVVLARERAAADQQMALNIATEEMRRDSIKAETEAVVARFTSITPGLVEALQSVGKSELLIKVAENLQTIPMGLNEGITDVLKRLFTGTVVEAAIADAAARGTLQVSGR